MGYSMTAGMTPCVVYTEVSWRLHIIDTHYIEDIAYMHVCACMPWLEPRQRLQQS